MAFLVPPHFFRHPHPRSQSTVIRRPFLKASVSNSQIDTPIDPPREAPPASPCSVCNGEKTVPCTLCNAFGFIRIDENTVWKTCHVCQGLGKILCEKCQPPDAQIPLDF